MKYKFKVKNNEGNTFWLNESGEKKETSSSVDHYESTNIEKARKEGNRRSDLYEINKEHLEKIVQLIVHQCNHRL